MLNRSEERSVVVKYRGEIGIVRCIVYQELLHVVKCLKNIDVCIPKTNKDFGRKLYL